MAKLVLGNAPKNFKRIIKVELLDGSTADIEMSFKYRTRKEYAALLDRIMAVEDKPKGKKDATVEEKAETASEIFSRLGEGTAEFILEIADGWDLDDKFNKASVADLVDRFPSATNAISESYRTAILEGKK